MLAHIGRNGLVKRVARDLDGRGRRNAVQTQNGDIRRAAANIDDHMALRPGDRQLRAKRGSERLLDQIDAARAGLHGGLNDRAFLDLGDAGRDGDDHAGLDEREFVDLLEKLLKHFLRHFIVADNAVAQRAHGDDVAGGAAKHIARSRADLQNLAGILVHGHDRRLAQDDAAPLYIAEHVCRAKVDADITNQFHSVVSFSLVFSARQTPRKPRPTRPPAAACGCTLPALRRSLQYRR